MEYVACRFDRYIGLFIATVFLYSVSFASVAEDTAKEVDISRYKVKLSLSNLPPSNNYMKNFPAINHDKASLRISSRNESNLLFAYLDNDEKTFIILIKRKIAYAPSIQPSISDKNKWDESWWLKYKNSLIKTVASGVKHIKINRYTKAGPMKINVIEINQSINPDILIEPALAANTLLNTKKMPIT
ncbi:MAG: hypothetical protein MZU79_02125 [Anaerotruncus sp.]|nr:hypothetical protein [Anaerotruncus sp.]